MIRPFLLAILGWAAGYWIGWPALVVVGAVGATLLAGLAVLAVMTGGS
jgi:hypothetical protein